MQNKSLTVSLLSCGLAVFSSCTSPDANAKTEASGANVEAKAAPAVPATRPVTIPAGTALQIRTQSTVSTKSATSGETVHGTLEGPLVVSGVVLAPKGADATLVVAESDPGGRVKGRAQIGLRLTSLEIAGEKRQVASNVFWREAPGTKKDDAVKVGIASGIGAAIGAIADGGKGAAIGAGAGAGAGTGVVLATRGAAAVVPAESVLSFRLQQPVTVEVKN